MAFMEWNEELSVGVQAMDADHKNLVGILNELHEGIVSGADRKALGFVMERLILCTKDHLAREERLLAQAGYPDADDHHKVHDLVIGKVLIAQANFRMGSTAVLTEEVMLFLKDWISDHILGSDKDYGPFLNSKGIA